MNYLKTKRFILVYYCKKSTRNKVHFVVFPNMDIFHVWYSDHIDEITTTTVLSTDCFYSGDDPFTCMPDEKVF